MQKKITAFCLISFIVNFLYWSFSWAGSLGDGLIYHYPFGAGVNGGGNGILHGASLTSNRLSTPDAAFHFDGQGDWIEVDDLQCALNYDNDWSVNIWVYLDGAGKHTIFFAGADGDAGAKQFAVTSKYVKMTHKADTDSDWRVNFKEPPHNTWHMYTVTWNKNGNLKVYVNGVLKGEDTEGELADFCPKHEPVIGALNFSRKTQFFKGNLDEFRLYDRTLSTSEISTLFNLAE